MIALPDGTTVNVAPKNGTVTFTATEPGFYEVCGSDKIPQTGFETAVVPVLLVMLGAAGVVLATKKRKAGK